MKAREDVFGGPGYFGPVKKVDVDMSNNKPLIWTGDMLRAVDYEVPEASISKLAGRQQTRHFPVQCLSHL